MLPSSMSHLEVYLEVSWTSVSGGLLLSWSALAPQANDIYSPGHRDRVDKDNPLVQPHRCARCRTPGRRRP
eukprot:6521867-Pyramimonas_sp.AAC.1